jgi:Kef-type K+ transport system membrane component KefB
MIVVLLAIALLCGGVAGLLLWGYGLFVALMGAAITASAAMFLAATVLVRLGARSSEQGQPANLIAQWLQRRDPH